MSRGDDLLLVESQSGRPLITRVNLATCVVSSDEPGASTETATNSNSGPAIPGAGDSEVAGLPTGTPGRDAGKVMDPAKVGAQAQHLSYPERLALPATLAVNANQERALAELRSESGRPAAPKPAPAPPGESTSLVPSRDGFVQFSVRLLESRITSRSAMKAPPKKSALDHLTAGNSQDAANEILNEMQRARGGDTVSEDESRYQVTLRRPGDAEGWTGEVVGPPALYPLQTVNVLAAAKSVLVFDKSNKLLWQSSLSFDVPAGLGALDPDNAPYGQGPCVERGASLYLFDQGVLTAFDSATGNVRWRLPSVGIVGLFFADPDIMYVNTTTAGPENLKYSRQIDISQKVSSAVLKVDSHDGKVLWSTEPGGLVNYVSGKFLYTVAYRMAEEPDEDDPSSNENAPPPYLRIRRISPKDGHMLWEHDEPRAPLDIQFDKNLIRLVFKKEVEVLKFLTF
jgi:outer membrane protein assembly factor BamB